MNMKMPEAKISVMRKKLVGLLMLGLCLSVYQTAPIGPPKVYATFQPHPTIIINGNKGFNSGNGVTGGTGTAADPYIIEGWEINASADRGIEIRNSNAYFVIRNVDVHSGGTGNDGIYTWNVTNGAIENAVVTGNRYGIFLDSNSVSTAISGSMISDSTIYGIYVRYSTNITMTGNSVLDSQSDGIFVIYSESINVFGNNLYSNTNHGIFLSYSPTSEIRNNTASGSLTGVQTNYSSNITISGNTIFANTSNGIFLNSSPNNTISENNLSNNENGIQLTHSDNISVKMNNVTSSASSGIRLSISNNATVMDNTLTSNDVNGIFLYLSNDTTISGNTVLSGMNGIHLSSSRGIVASGNIFLSSGLSIGGGSALDFNSHIITPDNLVNGNVLYYYKNLGSLTLDGIPAGQVIIANCTNVRAVNLSVTNTHTGIMMAYVTNVLISKNNASSNILDGISLTSSSNITVSDNTVSQNRAYGIHLTNSTGATITRNSLTSNSQDAIFLSSSNNLTISENTISSNGFGGTGFGVHLSGSTGVRVHKNNLLENRVQASDNRGAENSWDDGYPSGGNFWSDFSSTDNCSGPSQNVCPSPDGIGDAPYNIDGNSKDRYPVVQQLIFHDINSPPVANAGSDRILMEGTVVLLDGAASSDPDGNPLSFSWVQISGPPVSLSASNSTSPSFRAPEVGADTLLTFRLTVSDGSLSSSDTINVTVLNLPSTGGGGTRVILL